jgi:hypothetical protein
VTGGSAETVLAAINGTAASTTRGETNRGRLTEKLPLLDLLPRARERVQQETRLTRAPPRLATRGPSGGRESGTEAVNGTGIEAESVVSQAAETARRLFEHAPGVIRTRDLSLRRRLGKRAEHGSAMRLGRALSDRERTPRYAGFTGVFTPLGHRVSNHDALSATAARCHRLIPGRLR